MSAFGAAAGAAATQAISHVINAGVDYGFSNLFANQDLERKEKMFLKYGTPSAQKQMLQEAGLNPALMYSKGATSFGTPQVNTNSPTLSGAGVNPAVNMVEAQLLEENKDNLKADTEMKEGVKSLNKTVENLNEATKVLTNAKTSREEAETAYTAWKKELDEMQLSLQGVKTAAEVEEIYNKINLIEQEVLSGKINNKYLESTIKTNLAEAKSRIEINKIRRSVEALTTAEIRSKCNVNQAQAEMLKNSAEKLVKEIELLPDDVLSRVNLNKSMMKWYDQLPDIEKEKINVSAVGAMGDILQTMKMARKYDKKMHQGTIVLDE